MTVFLTHSVHVKEQHRLFEKEQEIIPICWPYIKVLSFTLGLKSAVQSIPQMGNPIYGCTVSKLSWVELNTRGTKSWGISAKDKFCYKVDKLLIEQSQLILRVQENTAPETSDK